MIEGVVVKELVVHRDEPDLDQPDVQPGFLMEIVRDDDGLLSHFGQSTLTVTEKDTVKAFHRHGGQDDLWFFVTGWAAVVLYDLREDSPTFGQRQIIYAGRGNYKVIVIPAGVAHGYKVMSDEPCYLFYHTTKPYDRDNPDEERIDPYDPTIGVDWESL